MSLRKLTTTSLFITLSVLSALTVVKAASYAPELPPAKAGATQCVEPTDTMRKEHYTFLMHQRDLTMYDGVRTKQHSLVECISCHIQPRADGSVPNHDEPDHFCSTCHEYAAVKIDCFQCHADKDPSLLGASGHGKMGEVHK